ncbi:DUF1778 domain-containing protein [Pseudomonas aeruginosa]|uniref:type II toxin-antitoxin system TacA family antitoxin n=1 Tax=Pseudomonas aeruginosa TaxID=287 RepID=UPI002B270CE9|nr:DUF1778 domain-containing protein [Pseudomonas aeruginosa]MEA8592248.1 DUF1778 domain-containing protein [Pseudomonas aeruginosa]
MVLKKEKPAPINMRVDVRKRNLIDAAVDLLRTDRTSFILDAACERAENVIMDQRLFMLGDDAFTRFEEALVANPVQGNKSLHDLLSRTPKWH